MLVSIIINNYNYDRFLRAAIESALNQTYRPVEVIVVDDGSTDQSRVTIERYGDQIAAVLKENGGQSSALTAGFAHSHGDIVIFLDADDVLLPHAAQAVVDAFHAQPDAAKIQYRMIVIDRNGQPSVTVKPPPHIPLPSGDLRRQELDFPFDLAWLPTSGNAFSTQVLRRILPIPEDYGVVGADWYLAHVAALLGPVVAVNEVCAYYRVHAGNHYEVAAPVLDLAHIRQTLTYTDCTRRHLLHYAEQLGLPDRPAEILSVSYVANRLASFKLARDQHPIVGDSPIGLLRLALIAVARRGDVSWIMRMLFRVWFILVIMVPKSLARSLIEVFFFPERRQRLNRWLGTLHAARKQLSETYVSNNTQSYE